MEHSKILLLDIETAPILASVWDIWHTDVGLNQIERDWYIISYAARWLGCNGIIQHDQECRRNLENDKELMKSLWKLLDRAEVVVAHNGDSFDIPRIRSRMLIHGMKPPSPFKTVDTLKVARKLFGFTSNKLEHIAAKLGVPKSKHKKFPGFEMWKACLMRNSRAWTEMRRYNKRDVVVLEKVYIAMRPWMEGHPNVGMFVNEMHPVCPKCGEHVQKRGFSMTNTGTYQRYQCVSCKGFSRGRYALEKFKLHRKRQLIN